MANHIRIRTRPGLDSTKLMATGMYGTTGVIRLQSATSQQGVYADVSGTGSTPAISLVSGTEEYDGYDPAGTSSTWYRVRYENADATRTSDWKAAKVARYD